jgi:hypothetical protein
VELDERHQPEAIECDGRNAAAARFVLELANRGVTVEPVDTQAHAQACSGLWMGSVTGRSGIWGRRSCGRR